MNPEGGLREARFDEQGANAELANFMIESLGITFHRMLRRSIDTDIRPRKKTQD
jgi:hypothetical protein